jgi:hypothetical protein
MAIHCKVKSTRHPSRARPGGGQVRQTTMGLTQNRTRRQETSHQGRRLPPATPGTAPPERHLVNLKNEPLQGATKDPAHHRELVPIRRVLHDREHAIRTPPITKLKRQAR